MSVRVNEEFIQAICCQGAPCKHPEACKAHGDEPVKVIPKVAAQAAATLLCQRWKAESMNHGRANQRR